MTEIEQAAAFLDAETKRPVPRRVERGLALVAMAMPLVAIIVALIKGM